MYKEAEHIDALIQGCKINDRKAQEHLYRNFYKAMMNLCVRFTKNEADAVAVHNLAFLKVFKNISQYDPAQANLYTWIRTITVNSCIDHIKSTQKFIATGSLSDAGDLGTEPEVTAKLNEAELLAMIRQLPPATQAVFNLYVTEGYGHKEIGTLLQISEGTSKWHLSEARKQLKNLIIQSGKY